MKPDFIVTDRGVVARASISFIDLSKLESEAMLTIHHTEGIDTASGILAFDVLMMCKPSAIEGKNLGYHRNAWIKHNFVSHPLMQFVAHAAMLVRPASSDLSMRWYRKAMEIHDATVPRPYGIKALRRQPQQYLRT